MMQQMIQKKMSLELQYSNGDKLLIREKINHENAEYKIMLLSIKNTKVVQGEKFESCAQIEKFIENNIQEARVINESSIAETSWFGVPIYCESQEAKEMLVAHFEENKIQTRNYFSGNILLHPGYKHLDDYKKYPNSNLALSNVFFIGCSPLYNEKILAYIEKVCKKWSE